jgi:uncharacterized membrane protein
MKETLHKTKQEVVRIAGKLKEITTIHDKTGKIIHQMILPLMVEIYPRDIIQMIVGATLLAIPLVYTEETWKLGEQLPLLNITGIAFVSILFISIFIFYNYYRNHIRQHKFAFLKRVVFTYLIALIVVAIILTLIQKAPWEENYILAIKRIIIVAFPASLSATIADVIK